MPSMREPPPEDERLDSEAAPDEPTFEDADDDPAAGGTDCDDADATVHPDAADAWYDGVDTDCSGTSDYADVLTGASPDGNNNLIPDACELPVTYCTAGTAPVKFT